MYETHTIYNLCGCYRFFYATAILAVCPRVVCCGLTRIFALINCLRLPLSNRRPLCYKSIKSGVNKSHIEENLCCSLPCVCVCVCVQLQRKLVLSGIHAAQPCCPPTNLCVFSYCLTIRFVFSSSKHFSSHLDAVAGVHWIGRWVGCHLMRLKKNYLQLIIMLVLFTLALYLTLTLAFRL